jgi:opacity protein-like surface antigen
LKKNALIVLLFCASASASASNSDHLYIAGNFLVGHETELEVGSVSVDESNDLGASAAIGYNFSVHPNVDFGVELEYQHFGKADFSSDASVEGNAVYINVRPKFIDNGNNLYSALILGVGSLDGELNVLGESYSDSDFSYQAGIEAGYMFDNVDISVGYRYRNVELDGVDINVGGVTLGMRYNF